jgi:hypothetical protein
MVDHLYPAVRNLQSVDDQVLKADEVIKDVEQKE